jgi:hypothetical protein
MTLGFTSSSARIRLTVNQIETDSKIDVDVGIMCVGLQLAESTIANRSS